MPHHHLRGGSMPPTSGGISAPLGEGTQLVQELLKRPPSRIRTYRSLNRGTRFASFPAIWLVVEAVSKRGLRLMTNGHLLVLAQLVAVLAGASVKPTVTYYKDVLPILET